MNNQHNFSELQRKIFDLTLALYRVTDFFPKGEILRKSLREKANEIFSRVTEYTYGYGVSNEVEAVAIFGRIESIKGYLEIARSLKLVRPINITVLEREYQFLADFFDPVRDLVNTETPSKNNSTIKRTPTGINSFRTSNGVEREISAGRVEPTTIKTDINHTAEPASKTIAKNPPTWEEFSDRKDTVERYKGNPESLTGFTEISDVISERQKKIVEHFKSSAQAKISDFYTAFGNISSKTIQRDLQDLVGKSILKKEGEKRWTTYTLNHVQ